MGHGGDAAQGHARRVEVRAAIGRGPGEQLGGDEPRTAGNRAGGWSDRAAEVDERAATVARDQQVLGFDVAVPEPGPMQEGEGAEPVGQRALHGGPRSAVGVAVERRAVDHVGRVERDRLPADGRPAEVVDPRQRGMEQAAQQAELLDERSRRLRALQRDHLERHVDIAKPVPGPEDLRGAAGAELPDDFVPAVQREPVLQLIGRKRTTGTSSALRNGTLRNNRSR